jgi:hypothetical protein
LLLSIAGFKLVSHAGKTKDFLVLQTSLWLLKIIPAGMYNSFDMSFYCRGPEC